MSERLLRWLGEWLGFGPYSHRAQVERDPKMRALKEEILAASYTNPATGRGVATGGNVLPVDRLEGSDVSGQEPR